MSIPLTLGDALLIVDVQNDFLPGGSLAVPEADAIFTPVNRLLKAFSLAGLPIFASRDYHPADHVSFVEQGGAWPSHCVAGTPGAAFGDMLALPDTAIIISKATSREVDAYSALDATDLSLRLRTLQTKRVFVCGLATDYCVAASARDLLAAGFRVVLVTDGMRGVNIHPGDSDKALHELREAGAVETTSADISP